MQTLSVLRRGNALRLWCVSISWFTGGAVSLGGSGEQPLQVAFRYFMGWSSRKKQKAKATTYPWAHDCFLYLASTDSFRRIHSISSLYTMSKPCVFILCQGVSEKQGWLPLIESNYLSFASHLTSYIVNNGKCFTNVSGSLCFIGDASHLLLADPPLT